MNWIDTLILVILGLGALEGFRRGLWRSLLAIVSYLAALVVAVTYYQRFGEFLNAKFNLVPKIAGFLLYFLKLPAASYTDKLTTSPTDQIISAIQQLQLPAVYEELLRQQVVAMLAQPANLAASIAEAITQTLAVTIINGVSFLLLAGLVAQGLQLVSGAVGLVLGGGAGGLDRFLGAGLGVVTRSITLTLILGLFGPFLSFMSLGSLAGKPALASFSEALSQSQLAPYFIDAFTKAMVFLHQFFPSLK